MKQALPVSKSGFERIAALSDGVFAILFTLMVIELKVPHTDTRDEGEFIQTLLKSLPIFAAVVLSFLILGTLWVEHHRLFRFINRYDLGLMWRNTVFLGVVSFLPFPTALFAEYTWSVTAFTIYACAIAMAGYSKINLLTYAWTHKLMETRLTASLYSRLRRRSFALPLTASLAIFVAYQFGTMAGSFMFGLQPIIAKLCANYGGKGNVRSIYSDVCHFWNYIRSTRQRHKNRQEYRTEA